MSTYPEYDYAVSVKNANNRTMPMTEQGREKTHPEALLRVTQAYFKSKQSLIKTINLRDLYRLEPGKYRVYVQLHANTQDQAEANATGGTPPGKPSTSFDLQITP